VNRVQHGGEESALSILLVYVCEELGNLK